MELFFFFGGWGGGGWGCDHKGVSFRVVFVESCELLCGLIAVALLSGRGMVSGYSTPILGSCCMKEVISSLLTIFFFP